MKAREASPWDTLPGELRLLLEIVAADDGSGGDDDALSERLREVDPDRLLRLARHHRVYPLVYTRLKTLDQSRVPRVLMQTLQREYLRNTLDMLRLTAEMERICRTFGQQRLPVLMLKGPALAYDLYGDISLRTSRDLDILVPLAELERAEGVLAALGYEAEEMGPSVLNDWRWRRHHKGYVHPGLGIYLEVHWRLSPGPSKEPGFEALWARRRKSLLSREAVYSLGTDDLFFYLAGHGARHGWFRLRWLLDMDRLVRQMPRTDGVCRLLRAHQSGPLGGQTAQLLVRLLRSPVDEPLRSLAEGRRAQQLAEQALAYIRDEISLHAELPASWTQFHKRYLFSIRSFRQKCVYLISLLYPYPKDAQTLPLPRPVHFLYFPLRPLLWVWRKTRKQAFT